MPAPKLLERFLDPLLDGNRDACRRLLHEQLEVLNFDATSLYFDLLWPAMETVERLYRQDRINVATEHLATRMMRVAADQLQPHLPRLPSNSKRMLISCADGESEELGAQMTSDLFEARGWEVYFLGGGVPNDEILQLVGRLQPQLLVVFGTQPAGVPQVRALVDLIRTVGGNPTMNIMISGGVFNRAEGLWEEVHADCYAATAQEALPIAEAARPRKGEVPIPGAPRKRRRRRRNPAAMAGAAA